MRNLHADVLELFSSLDGRDRQEWAVEHHQGARSDYYNYRYATDPEFRARRLEATHRYRDRKLGMNRRRRVYGPLPIIHGTYLGYQGRGCRCTDCRAASAAYQRGRRARMKAVP